MTRPTIKVVSRSFSSNLLLRSELLDVYHNTIFNEEGCIYDEHSLTDYLKDADGVVVGLENITASLLSECPKLKIISKYGVGLDNVDQEACRSRNVTIGWSGGVNRRGVAEMVLCFMIGLSRNIFFSARSLSVSNNWLKDGGSNLGGKKIGIIGVGNIGKEVIKLLKPFSCIILANDIIEQPKYYQREQVKESSKEEIFSSADIVSIHTPLTDETRLLINDRVFSEMKNDAFLVNVARGGIVDQNALKNALSANKIAGAAIDVFEVEPCNDEVFLNLPNLYCTPHTGGSSMESILAMGRSAIKHLVNHFN